jgi:hypothetical protein
MSTGAACIGAGTAIALGTDATGIRTGANDMCSGAAGKWLVWRW